MAAAPSDGVARAADTAPTTRAPLPSGSVTFLFSDIEGSTRLAASLAPDVWAQVLQLHDRITDAAIAQAGGAVVKHEGDGCFAVFATADAALVGACDLTRALVTHAWPGGRRIVARVGLHTGNGRLTPGGTDYVGIDVHYAARLAAAANGGQVVLSDSTRRALGAAVPAGVELRALGPRRLKDFDEPRPVYRAMAAGMPDDDRPLRAGAATDLPQLLSGFVGRDTEIAAILDALGRARVVTLTGPGGAGKTRLSIAAAEAARDRFADGVAFVELAPLGDAGLIPAAIAGVLGVGEEPGRPIGDSVRATLAGRTMLLILDNVEHLLPDAGSLLADLVRGAPGLTLLTSSREPLRISGEQELPVPPLRATEAMTLFVDRARLVRPDLVLDEPARAIAAEIVRRLGGLPLAIELAAARTRLLSLPAIAERLGRALDLLGGGSADLPERQRTLRATVAWSHDLLDRAEAALFRRMAVFAGDVPADLGASVVDPDGDLGVDVLDGLASLVDKSLLTVVHDDHGDTLFGRHAFVGEYAAERLEASGERPALERRHAHAMRAFAIAHGAGLTEVDASRRLTALDHGIHDLRRAMEWSISHATPELGQAIIGATWRWWQIRAQLREGRSWAARVLAGPGADRDPIARSAALSAAGGLAYWSTEYAATRAAYAERLAIAERLGDPRELAEAHYDIGFLGMVDKDTAFLRREEETARDLFLAVGDTSGAIRARQALSIVHFLDGDLGTARALEEENLADFRAQGAWYRAADSMVLLAAIHRAMGDRGRAIELARDGIRSTTGPVGGATLGALAIITVTLAEAGEAETAARLAGAIAAIRAETGEALASVSVLHLPDPADVVRERLGAQRAADLMAEGAGLSMEQAVALGLASADSDGT